MFDLSKLASGKRYTLNAAQLPVCRHFSRLAPALIPHWCVTPPFSSCTGTAAATTASLALRRHWICRTHLGAAPPSEPGSSSHAHTCWKLAHSWKRNCQWKYLKETIINRERGRLRSRGKRAPSFSEYFFLLAWDNYWRTDTISCHSGHT